MTENKKEEFVNEYKKFYKSFFECMENSVKQLADIHEKYPTQYQKILESQENPEILGDLIDGLSNEQKGILLSVLFKAAEFGRKFMLLMEMKPKEKREFAKDLKNFVEELDEM